MAPQLLPPARPAATQNWGRPEDLTLRYRYDFLPKGMISRLTVRLHRFVRSPELAWATGVLFERDGTQLLVELLPSGKEIELRARGPEHKALLSVVAAELDALNATFDGLRDKVHPYVPCICDSCGKEAVPHFFALKALRRRKELGRFDVECERSFARVDVQQLLDGLRTERPPAWAKEPREIRIFLASSAELREDRDAFELYFRQQNDKLREQGMYLKIVRWENFLDAMSATRLQDEYNQEVRNSDITVCLFFTKVGKYTEEEFDTAYGQFLKTGKPRIFTYFKNAVVNTGNLGREFGSRLDFQDKLKALGHFPTAYNGIEHLKLHFREQLDHFTE